MVDDNEANRDVLSRHLERQGYTVAMAESGRRALQMMGTVKFDLVLLDIMLPKKDGLQILRDNKSNPPKRPNGPIVALTNLGQDAVIKQCFELGCAGYMIKSSLNPDQVLTEIGNYLKASVK